MKDEFFSNIRNRVRRPAEFCFYAGLILEIVIVILEKSSYIIPNEGQLFRITFLLFAIKMIATKYDRKELLWLLAFLAAGTVCWRMSGRNEILRMAVFAAACKDLDYRKILRIMLYGTAAGSLGIMLLSVFHVLGTVTITQDFDGAVDTRLVLGFGHPNSLHTMIAMLQVLALYLYGKKMKIWHGVCLLVFDAVLFYLTKCSMGALTMGLSVLWTAAINHRTWIAGRLEAAAKTFSRSYRGKLRAAGTHFDRLAVFCEVIFAAALLFTMAGAVFGGASRLIQAIDYHFLTGRIATIWDFNFHDGTLSTWTLFGSRLNDRYFDLGWIRLIYWYGVIPAAMVIAAVFMLFRRIRKLRDERALMLVTILCVYTSMEAHLVSDYLGRNYLLVLFAALGVFS